jgi:hypothetical protein
MPNALPRSFGVVCPKVGDEDSSGLKESKTHPLIVAVEEEVNIT